MQFVPVCCLILPPKALAHKDPADFKHDDEELIRKLVKKVGLGKCGGRKQIEKCDQALASAIPYPESQFLSSPSTACFCPDHSSTFLRTRLLL